MNYDRITQKFLSLFVVIIFVSCGGGGGGGGSDSNPIASTTTTTTTTTTNDTTNTTTPTPTQIPTYSSDSSINALNQSCTNDVTYQESYSANIANAVVVGQTTGAIPSFSLATQFYIQENTEKNDSLEVLTVNASDNDSSNLTYSIVAVDGYESDVEAFSINAFSGVLVFKALQDYETISNADKSYRFKVSATDFQNTVELAVTVTVLDVNEAVKFDETNFSVIENTAKVNDLIFTDSDSECIALNIATQEDFTNEGKDFSLEDEDLFALDWTGEKHTLSFKTAPDYDRPNDANTDNVYKIRLTTTDGNLTSFHQLQTTVTKEGDGPSALTLSGFDIPEQVLAATIGNLTVTNIDPTPPIYTFEISGSNGNLFEVVYESDSYALRLKADQQVSFAYGGNNSIDISIKVNGSLSSSTKNFTLNVTTTVYYGGTGADNFSGSAGDDVLNGQGGNDVINGGDGNDAVIFSANLGDFDIVTVDGETTLLGKDSSGSAYKGFTTTLINVESIRFNDQTVSLPYSTAPVVLSVIPADQAVGVSRAIDTVQVNFDQEMDQSSYTDNIYLRDSSGNKVSSSVGPGSNFFQIQPYDTLSPSTVYTVVVTTDVKDNGGTPLESEFNSSFTTQAVSSETTAPTISSVTPSDQTVNISINTATVQVNFSEEMDKSSYEGNIYLEDLTGNRITFVPGPGALFYQLNLSSSLQVNTTYRIVATTSVKDVNGNALVQKYKSYFSTGDVISFPQSNFTGGSEIKVNEDNTGQKTQPRVAVLEDDTFVVVWMSTNQAASDSQSDIYGQHFTKIGGRIGDEFRVNQCFVGDQRNPAISKLIEGPNWSHGFVVAWDSSPNTANTGCVTNSPDSFFTSDIDTGNGLSSSVVGQVFDKNHNIISIELGVGYDFLINNLDGSSERHADVVESYNYGPGEAGGFYVVWTTGNNVEGKLFDSRATDLTGERTVFESRSEFPSIANIEEDGTNVVIWQGGTSNYSIQGRLTDSYLDNTGDVITFSQVSDNHNPDASSLPIHSYAIVASRGEDDIVFWRCKDTNCNGAGRQEAFYLTDSKNIGGHEEHPRITALKNGLSNTIYDDNKLVVVYETTKGNPKVGQSSYGKKRIETTIISYSYDGSASSLSENKREDPMVVANPVDNGTDTQLPDVAAFSDGSYVVVWQAEDMIKAKIFSE